MKKTTTLLLALLITLVLCTTVQANPANYYTVKEGDSLYEISTKYGVSVDYLINVNKLQSTLIHPGLKLITGIKESSPVKITINGKIVHTDGFIQDDRTFVPIRFVSEMSGAEVDWFPIEKSAVVIYNQKVILLKSNSNDVYVNGDHQIIDAPAFNLNGRIFVPLRFVSETNNIGVEWDPDQKTVHLTVNNDPKPLSYSQDDLYWMSRIIRAESEGQPLHGQLAVGSVVMNRVASKEFPNSVKDVVFQPKQFSPVSDGAIYKEPTQSAITIAKMVLNGYHVEKDALYFLNPDKSTSFWIVHNKRFVASIGDHDFYK